MGRELDLIALPTKCSLLQQVDQHLIDAELLSLVPGYLRQRRLQRRRVPGFAQGDPDFERLVDAVEELVTANPRIEHRYCELERRFEWLEWLLVHCAGDDGERKWAEQALRGEAPLSPTARSTQGFLIRSTSAPQAGLISQWLQGLTVDQLRRHYDPDAMADADLYKWGQIYNADQPDSPESLFQVIAQDFTALRQFYRDVTAHAETVLAVMD